jgi:hypothetical protein
MHVPQTVSTYERAHAHGPMAAQQASCCVLHQSMRICPSHASLNDSPGQPRHTTQSMKWHAMGDKKQRNATH